MQKTTLYLPDELARALREAARRTGTPQSELVREALRTHLETTPTPRPRSIGIIEGALPRGVSSKNVKNWIREQWSRKAAGRDTPARRADA